MGKTVVPCNPVFQKCWYGLRKHFFVLKVFDQFLRGALLVVTLLETNALLLLRRDAGTGYLPSLLEGWALMGGSAVAFATGTLLCWIGRGKRPLALSACLGCTALLSLVVLAFPYKEPSSATVELCGGDIITVYSDASSRIDDLDDMAAYRITFLILTVVMCFISLVSIWAHGLTYLDDHNPQYGPFFYGILISVQLSVGISGKNWLRPSAFRDDWWEAHISLSMLVLGFALLFILFPSKMPEWKTIESNDDKGYLKSLMRMLRNKVLCVQILALSLLCIGLFGFLRLDDAFVQARFHVEAIWSDPQTSRGVSNIFRALIVVLFTMVFRFRFIGRRDGIKSNTSARVGGVVAFFAALLFGIITLLNCSLGDISDLEEGGWQQPQCSSECRCNSERYGFTPVCDVATDVTYFSPCSAGCNTYNDLNGFALFTNCSCGTNYVARGSCSLPSCRSVYSVYQILYALTVGVSAAAVMMQGLVVLRAVQRWDKCVAQGLAFSTILLLTNIPGQLLYKVISNYTCAYAGNDAASCMFHKPSLWWASFTSAILVLISGVLSIVSSKMNRDSIIVYVDDNDINVSGDQNGVQIKL